MLRDVTVRLGLNIDDFRAKSAAATAESRRLAAELQGQARKATAAERARAADAKRLFAEERRQQNERRQALNEVGGTFGKVGLAAGAAAVVGVRSFANFDEAMSGVEATGDDARKNIDRLRDAAIDMGAKTKFNATESATAIEAMEKAGVRADDVLGGGLAGSLDLAAAGGLGVADAAEIAATAMNQFGLQGSDASHIADVLAAAAGKAMGDVTDMAGALKYIGPVAKQMGIGIEESAGTIALLAQNGILGDQAGTSLRGMLTALTSPSKIASKTMQQLGIDVYDASGKFVGFDGVAGQLKSSLGDLTNAQRDEALGRIFGNEQITAARVLYQGGAEEVRKWTKAVDDSGYAQETAATKMDNFKGDVEKLGGALESALIGTATNADGPLRNLVQSLTSVVDAYNDLPQPIKDTTAAAVGLTAVIGGGAFVLTRAVTGYAQFRDAVDTLGSSFQNTSKKSLLLRGGALAGGLGLATIADDAKEANAGLGILTTTAAGAAIGFAVGGPLGAAVGGAGGAIYGLVDAIGDSEQAFEIAAGRADAYAASLDGVSGAATKATRGEIFKDLQQAGAPALATQFGINPRDLVDAAMGSEQAAQRIQNAFSKIGQAGGADAKKLSDIIYNISGAFDDAQKSALDARGATQDWSEALKGVPKAVRTKLENAGYQASLTEVRNLAQQYKLTPAQVRTVLRALNYAEPDINNVLDSLARMPASKTVVLTTVERTIVESLTRPSRLAPSGGLGSTLLNSAKSGYTGGRVPSGYARGGRVPGTPPSDPREDNVLAMTQRGNPLLVRSREWIVNEKASDANNEWLAAINGGLNLNDVFGAPPAFAIGGRYEAASRLDTLRMRQRIRQIQSDLRRRETYKGKDGKERKRLELRGIDREVAEAELREARRELAGTQRANTRARRRGVSAERYNELQDRAEERAQDQREKARDAGRDQRSTRREAARELRTVDLNEFSTPAAFERNLRSKIADAATLGSLLVSLRKKGAAPWLIAQFVAAGPSRGVIRLARKYDSDSNALRNINTLSGQLTNVTDAYARITTDPKFAGSGRWTNTRAQGGDVRTLNFNVEARALDNSSVAREIARQTDMALSAQALGAGV